MRDMLAISTVSGALPISERKRRQPLASSEGKEEIFNALDHARKHSLNQ
jgi:hypothetical protein